MALAFSLLPGCDNPACIFGGTCNPDGSAGGAGANPPTLPNDHAWLKDGAPNVTRALPTGTDVSLQSPIVLVFDESMAASTFVQSLELVATGSPVGIPIAAQALVADGRVWVGAAGLSLAASTEYRLRVIENRIITDLQGVPLTLPADRVLLTFSTAVAAPLGPRVLTTFPPNNSTQQSATGEIVVIFDRPMNPLTVNGSSFLVTVNGATPANNPAPEPLVLAGAATDTRVWRYRSTNAAGQAVPFPNLAAVAVELSPTSAPILPASGSVALARTQFDYTTAAVAAPRSASITSFPADAIGISNFDGTSPLSIALDLSGAQVGDSLRIYLFGRTRDNEPRATLLARSAVLDATLLDVNLQVATIGETQIDLASSVAPVAVRLAEEEIKFAFSLQRGGYQTPVRLLDIDDLTSGVQGPVLDVTPPTLLGLTSSGTVISTYATDQRDLVIVGRANEEIRACEVSVAALGATNGALPLTAASNADGVFIAQPVPLGLVDLADQPLQTRVWVYDRAFNRTVSSALTTARQVGAVGPGAAVPGAPQVQVEVRNARTLAPISGALVVTHEDLGASVNLVAFANTDANGRVTLAVGAVGEAMVTVDAANHNLLTFHGVRASRISVLVEPTSSTAGTSLTTGTLTSSIPSLSSLEAVIGDSRAVDGANPTFSVQPCSSTAGTLVCPFGPQPVRVGAVGALATYAVDTPPTAFNFSATSFLRGFASVIPLPAAAPGAPSVTSVTLQRLLDDPAVDLEERPLAAPPTTLDAFGVAGVVLAQLDGDPRVTIEGAIPGVGGSFLAGLGVALDGAGSPTSQWQVRGAYPGAADPTDGKYVGDELGTLFQRGTLAGDLFLRIELRDQVGARSIARVPLDAVGGTTNVPSAPVVVSPLLGSTTAGPSYDVLFTDTLPNGGNPGLYRVTLVGAGSRRWTLWRPDGSGAQRRVHVPDLVAAGGAPLGPGAVAASVRAYSAPTFDPAAFLFSDLDKLARTVADSAVSLFSQP